MVAYGCISFILTGTTMGSSCPISHQNLSHSWDLPHLGPTGGLEAPLPPLPRSCPVPTQGVMMHVCTSLSSSSCVVCCGTGFLWEYPLLQQGLSLTYQRFNHQGPLMGLLGLLHRLLHVSVLRSCLSSTSVSLLVSSNFPEFSWCQEVVTCYLLGLRDHSLLFPLMDPKEGEYRKMLFSPSWLTGCLLSYLRFE